MQYLRNCPEYLESFVAALKASMVPVNTNYRYGPAELGYLWQDCDARAVVFAGSFTATIERTRASVPGVLAWLWVDDGTGPCPPWAVPVRVGGRAGHALAGACVGPGRRRHHPAVHRGHHRAAQGRDLAPGRPHGVAGQRRGRPLPG